MTDDTTAQPTDQPTEQSAGLPDDDQPTDRLDPEVGPDNRVPEVGPDDDSLAAAVFHLARLLSRRERRGPRGGFAVHRGRGRILAVLALRDQMTQKELAYLLGVRSQSLGEQLAQLERDGLVQRTTDESDRRTWLVTLTDAGREAAAQATDSGGDPFAVLSADERDALAALLEKVAADLRTDDDRRPRPDAPEGWGRPGPWPGGGRGLGPRRGRGRRGPEGPDGWTDAPARGRGRRGPDGLARETDAPVRRQGRCGPGWAW